MAYKILYLEDLDADSIKSDLNSFGFEVDTNKAGDFANVIEQFNNQYDAYILDYELTANEGVVNAPTYAQTLRSKNAKIKHKDAPIIIISNDKNKTISFQVFSNSFYGHGYLYDGQGTHKPLITCKTFNIYIKDPLNIINQEIKK